MKKSEPPGLIARLRASHAHTYASENADLYRGFDNGQRRAAESLEIAKNMIVAEPLTEKIYWKFVDLHKHEKGKAFIKSLIAEINLRQKASLDAWLGGK